MMSFPSLKRLPVLHFVRLLFILVVRCILECLFGLFIRDCLPEATHKTCLEGTMNGKPSVLPQQNSSLIVCTGEHTSEIIPSDAINWTIVSCEYCKKSLGLCSFILKKRLHQLYIALNVLFPLLELLPTFGI